MNNDTRQTGSFGCAFCAAIEGRSPISLVHADALVCAFVTTHPINPGHTLVVPRAHATYIHELEEDVGQQIFTIAARIAQAIRESSVPCDDVALFLADGPSASQKVPHVHLHVIPRRAADRFQLNSQGGVTHPENAATRVEMDEAASLLRATYDEL